MDEVNSLSASVVCNRAQVHHLLSCLNSVYTNVVERGELRLAFDTLLSQVKDLIVKFQTTSHVINTWMNHDDSVDIDAVYEELRLILIVDLDRCALVGAKSDDEFSMQQIVLADFKQYNGLKPDEVRILSEEVADRVKLLHKLRSGAVKVADVVSLRLVDVSMLKLGDVLGEGGFGITYSAELRGIKVAVKKLKLNAFEEEASAEQKAELYKEAVMMQVHSFPGVIKFIGVDDAVAPTMIVMEAALFSFENVLYKPKVREKCEKLLLCDSIKESSILVEISCTLAFLHSVGVIHRDIKPGNILIMPDGSCRVTDFGLAQQKAISNVDHTNRLARMTADNPIMNSRGTTVKGTMAYMAPELILADEGCIEYSEASDVYAFGIMWNEWLCEKKPFEGMDDDAILLEMITSEGTLRPEFAGAYNTSFLFCNSDPTKRFSLASVNESSSGRSSVVGCGYLESFADNLLLASMAFTGHYTGDMQNGLRHGHGTLKCLNGDTYVGGWLNDKRHGYGEWRTSKGYSYCGDWENNSSDGFGKCVYENGDTYEGQWEGHARSGQGIHRFANGDVYEGSFDVLINGFGKMTYANGDVYDGRWRNDLKDGDGVIKYANGDVYRGEWNNDSLLWKKIVINGCHSKQP